MKLRVLRLSMCFLCVRLQSILVRHLHATAWYEPEHPALDAP